jgi:hypothetical protein
MRWEETGMNKGEKLASKHPRKAHPANPRMEDVKRQDADERLDDARRQTFPASDALSIVQSARGE